jgi:flagellar biosynthesis protein FlhF
MDYFTEQALTHAECLQKIRTKYGDRAKVMIQKTVRIGGFLGIGGREGVEMSGIIYTDYSRYAAPGAKKPLDFEEAKQRVLAAAGKGEKDTALQKMAEDIKGIKDKLDSMPASAAAFAAPEHVSLSRLEEMLDLNDFSPSYSRALLDRVRKEISLEGLDDFDTVQERAVEWIGASIGIYEERPFRNRPRIMVLVGPTGVGKTTTIAKLAALYGEREDNRWLRSVRLITIDNYRIGAQQQLEKYGAIMEIPVSSVNTYKDLRKTIALYSEDVDFILVDTIGKSPRDAVRLAEMKELLSACGSQAEMHLALAATTKSSDIREILQQFEPFNYQSVIITKLDETIRVGNVISALADRGKRVSYITTGQSVPSDIERASVVRLLINLEGFAIDREKAGRRFPAPVNTEKDT